MINYDTFNNCHLSSGDLMFLDREDSQANLVRDVPVWTEDEAGVPTPLILENKDT